MSRPVLKVLQAHGLSILRQLELESALLRGDPSASNWFLINAALPSPAIVMGISGQPERLLNLEVLLRAASPSTGGASPVSVPAVPVLRRFSGGGTVLLDAGSVMTSLVCNAADIPGLPAQPRAIMTWTEQLYGPAFAHTGAFSLQEQDYAIGELKVGGNAQSITGARWLHHTSFLFDFDEASMTLLRHPPKAPAYRQHRPHSSFMGRLKAWFPSPPALQAALLSALSLRFDLHPVALAEVQELLQQTAPPSPSSPSLPPSSVRWGAQELSVDQLSAALQRQRQGEGA